MRKPDEPCRAVLISDLHLCMTPPPCRQGEPNWFDAMRRPLDEIKRLSKENDGAPVLCAGDVFDHWKAPPELVNFALDALPEMWAIPGQHDLPLHNHDDIHKSAFWTLVKTGKIRYVSTTGENFGGRPKLKVFGFPWGVPILPPTDDSGGISAINLALIHEYTWAKGTGHPGASETGRATAAKYKGYKIACTGDNHVSFDFKSDGLHVFNVGVMMRRRSDEGPHRPRVGLVQSDGSVETHYLDTSKDVFEPVKDESPVELRSDMKNFLADLEDLDGSQSLDFHETLTKTLHKQTPAVRQLLLESLEHSK